MKSVLNSISNKDLIKINDKIDFFCLEEDIKIESPVSDYYFKHSDLSINLVINLKWSLYAYFFFKSILDYLDSDECFEDMSLSGSLIDDLKIEKRPKIFMVDDFRIESFEDFKTVMETEYVGSCYGENAMVHFKIKLNIEEFVILENVAYPRLCYTID